MLPFFEQTAPVFNVHESMRKAKKQSLSRTTKVRRAANSYQ